jgi:hypothetical protein
MLANRSIPRCAVIPELIDKDVLAARKWLCDAFGFTMRIDMGSRRARLNIGDGALVLTEPPKDYKGDCAYVMVHVEGVYSHGDRP